jgi:hypothetical protein
MTGPDVFTLALAVAAALCFVIPVAIVLSDQPTAAPPARASVGRHRRAGVGLADIDFRMAGVVCVLAVILLFSVAIQAVTYRPTVQIGAWS